MRGMWSLLRCTLGSAAMVILAGLQSAKVFFRFESNIPGSQIPGNLSNIFESPFFFFPALDLERGIFKPSVTQPHKSKLSHRLL